MFKDHVAHKGYTNYDQFYITEYITLIPELDQKTFHASYFRICSFESQKKYNTKKTWLFMKPFH